jgi:hypothetical protein
MRRRRTALVTALSSLVRHRLGLLQSCAAYDFRKPPVAPLGYSHAANRAQRLSFNVPMAKREAHTDGKVIESAF